MCIGARIIKAVKYTLGCVILQVSDRLIAAADRLAAKNVAEQFTAADDEVARQEGAGSHS